jgi:hypothetical protein
MSDLLSASSLLMAIAAILFSLWYAEISKTLEISPKAYKEDNVQNAATVKGVLYSKALPVATMALMVACIFLPDALKLMLDSKKLLMENGFASYYKNYDAVRTAYCYVSLLSTILAFYMMNLVMKLYILKRQMT